MIRTIYLLSICLCFAKLTGQSKIDYPVYFAYKIATLDSTEEKRLYFFLKNFDSFSIDSINIRGYCDDRGRKKMNDTLSLQRARNIHACISGKLPYQLPSIISGEGSIKLEGKEGIDSQRTLNRRAEVVFFYSLQKRKIEPNKIQKKTKDTITSIAPQAPTSNIHNFLKSAKVGETIDLKIYFEGSSSAIKKTSAPELINLLNFMKDNPSRKIKITGHIYDPKAPTEKDAFDVSVQDRNLSKNRAKKVYTFLINNGIASDRLSYEGMAAKFPRGVSPEDDRRVEIQIVE